MKIIKAFEAFKMPDRNPQTLVPTIFSEIGDEFGDQVKWSIYVMRSGSIKA